MLLLVVHPYGPINTFGEFGDIHQMINAMKLRCDQLKSSGSIAVNVLKISQVRIMLRLDSRLCSVNANNICNEYLCYYAGHIFQII